MGRHLAFAAATAGLIATLQTPASAQTTCTPARAMILFDRSTSMHLDVIGTSTKWALATAAVKEIASTYENEIELGLSLFPAEALSCSGATVAVAPAVANGDEIAAGLQGPVRNMFTPIGAALASMAKEPSLHVAGRPQRYVILVTDGHEDCPADADEQSIAQTVGTVTGLRGMGIATFVVGFGQPSNGDGVDAAALNQIAVAGGTAIAGCNAAGVDPAAADLCYYQADDYDALVAALESIALDVSTEVCDGLDNNCNGQTDEDCRCIENTMRPCGGVIGACKPGTQTCHDGEWSACEGAVEPKPETCDSIDNDCDGAADEGCQCASGETIACGGPAVGVCRGGIQTCRADGTWGPCTGAVAAATETCDGRDNDCDGTVDEVAPGNVIGLCGPDQRCHAGRCIPGPGRLAGAGVACQVGFGGGSPALPALLLVAAGLLLARRRKLLTIAVLLLGATSARAQNMPEAGFALDRFEPAERGSDWFVLDSVEWSGHLRPSVGLTADFAERPLVVYDEHEVVRTVVVDRQLFTHVGGSLVVRDTMRFGVGLPIVVSQGGALGANGEHSFPPPQSAAVGDLRLSGDVRVLGGPGRPFNLGLGLSIFVPTGSRAEYSGDEAIRIMPHALAGGRAGRFQYGAKLGLHYRGIDDAIDGSPIGTEVVAAAAAGARLAGDRLLIGPEIYTSTVVSDSDAMFDERSSPLEALLGAHLAFPGGWRARAGAGLGFGRGLGTPAFRVLAGLEWTWTPTRAVEPPPSDRDRDLIFDREDACPDMPGVRTTDPATNGCPPDRDSDGILDAEDACPEVAGVRTDDPKTHGCPPPPEPEPVPAAEPPPPAKVHIDVERQQIVILEQIQFEFGKATILPESESILTEVRDVLESHPGITKVRIEGHTDSVGSDGANKRLSRRRAQSVMTWLVAHGIERGRLTAAGFGEQRPIDTNRTADGRRNNRRVEFHIEEGTIPSS